MKSKAFSSHLDQGFNGHLPPIVAGKLNVFYAELFGAGLVTDLTYNSAED
jgi:hypothetical protein